MESGLNAIRADISLSEVAPLDRRRMVAFVNCFVMKMTDYLNNFAIRADNLILEAEKKLRVTDRRLKILEHKLSHINVTVDKQQQQSSGESKQPEESKQQEKSKQQQQASPQPPEAPEPAVEAPAAPQQQQQGLPEPSNQLLVKDDPVFAKYFKMLKLGVVEQAVKIKMTSEGVDPAFLDTPDAPSPNQPSTSQIKEEDDDNDSLSSFSDSD